MKSIYQAPESENIDENSVCRRHFKHAKKF